MKKLVVLLVLVALGWFFRAPLGDLMDRARGLGPKMKTEMDMRGYEDALVAFIEREGRPPGDLEGWLDRNFSPKGPDQPASRDRYGTPYQVNRDGERGIYVLRSCGPDRQCGTEDDLVQDLVG